MAAVNWENPFEDKASAATPDLWIPGRKAQPVDLGAIRKRQQGLLTPIKAWVEAAEKAVRRIARTPGGEGYLAALRRQVLVEVLYRHPDHPGVLQVFGPVPMTGLSVVCPAEVKPVTPVLGQLLQPQTVVALPPETPESIERRKAILAAEKELGIARQAKPT